MTLYVANHALEQRSFSVKEPTLMFLSHLDNPRYKLAVKECEVAIIHLPTIPTIYVVPEIAGTIDQLRSASLPTDTTTKCALIRPTSDWETRDSSQRPHTRHIRCPASYCENDDISLDQYNEYVDPDDDPPWICLFRRGGSRTSFDQGGRGRGRFSRDIFEGR